MPTNNTRIIIQTHNSELPPEPIVVDEGMPDAWAVSRSRGTDIIGIDHAAFVTVDL
jgi:hypothetical protein